MNSSSLGRMSYYTLAIEFLGLKYYTNYLFYQFFLSPPDFFFFFFLSNSLRCFCLRDKAMTDYSYPHRRRQLMMSKKSLISHTIPTRSTPDLPNTEKYLTESTGVVPAKDPRRLSQKRAPIMLESMSFRNCAYLIF